MRDIGKQLSEIIDIKNGEKKEKVQQSIFCSCNVHIDNFYVISDIEQISKTVKSKDMAK